MAALPVLRVRNDRRPGARSPVVLALALLLASGSGCVGAARSTPVVLLPRDGALAPSDIPPGTRIRYYVRGDWRGLRTGNVARASRDTVWLAPARPLAVAQLRRLEVSFGGTSEERRMGRGALVGAVTGAALGALAPRRNTVTDAPGRREYAMAGTMYGMVIGGLAGLLLFPGERWERIELPPKQ